MEARRKDNIAVLDACDAQTQGLAVAPEALLRVFLDVSANSYIADVAQVVFQGCYGRGTSVGRPAAFKMEQPLGHLLLKSSEVGCWPAARVQPEAEKRPYGKCTRTAATHWLDFSLLRNL